MSMFWQRVALCAVVLVSISLVHFDVEALECESAKPLNLKISVDHRTVYYEREVDIFLSNTSIALSNCILASAPKLDTHKRHLSEADKALMQVAERYNKGLGSSADQLNYKKFYWAIRLRASLAPAIIEGRVREGAREEIDRTINKKITAARKSKIDEVTALIDQGIEEQMAAQFPNLNQMPAEIQAQIHAQFSAVRNQMVDDAIVQVDAALADIKAEAQQEAYRTADKRLDQVKTESTYQGVALVFMADLSPIMKNAVFFAHVGKDKPDIGAERDHQGLTDVEEMRGLPSQVQRAMSTAPTGFLEAGVKKRLDAKTTLTVTGVLFHAREPWTTATPYIENILLMSDEQFEKHQDWHEIDSFVQTFRVYRELGNQILQGIELYVSAGTFDGDKAAAAGTVFHFDSRNRLFVDAYVGQRDFLRKGYSAFYAHDTSVSVMRYEVPMTVYGGGSILKEARERDYNDCVIPAAGTKLTLYSGRIAQLIDAQIVANTELARRHCKGEKDRWDFRAGLSLDLQWGGSPGPAPKRTRDIRLNETLMCHGSGDFPALTYMHLNRGEFRSPTPVVEMDMSYFPGKIERPIGRVLEDGAIRQFEFRYNPDLKYLFEVDMSNGDVKKVTAVTRFNTTVLNCSELK
ncbi:MAG: hypothetical protein H6624_02540 [Bdellovibrionaceae bacterium]|nr:hypothetical protein [Bdellovibrionales bacterium]MCB9083189.1 hypothetical protein [Pseudobdellovibrionaceae bacterium]